MKIKCFVLLLIAALTMQCAVFAYPADIDDVPMLGGEKKASGTDGDPELFAAYNLLKYLGIVNMEQEQINKEAFVERGYAAGMFGALWGDVLENTETGFKDVKPESPYYAAVTRAAAAGIIDTSEDRFYPARETETELCAQMAVKSLGLEKTMHGSYMSYAAELGLFKGLGECGENITMRQLMLMLKNCLDAPYAAVEKLHGEYTEIKLDKNKTYMQERFNIILLKGIVTGFGHAFLSGERSMGENKIEINNAVFTVECKYDGLLIGKNVCAYVDTGDEKNVVASIWEDEKSNTVIELFKDDIVQTGADFIISGSERRKKHNVSKSAKIILNDVLCGNMEQKNDILSACENVTLIDNDGDNTYDVVAAVKYRYCIVKSVSSYSDTAAFKYGMGALDENDDNAYLNITGSGMKMKISELKSGDVVSLAYAVMQDGREVYNMVLSRDRITDTLTAISENGKKTVYTVGGEEYELTDEYKKVLEENTDEIKPVLGQSCTFLISHDGKIAGASAENEFSFGYLVGTGFSNSTGQIKVYTVDGKFNVYDLDDKVTFYCGKWEKGSRIDSEEAIELLKKDGKTDYTVLGYTLNGQKKVKKLALPLDRTKFMPGTTDYPLTLDYSTNGSNVRVYRNILESRYSIPYILKIIQYPKDDEFKTNEKAYTVLGGSVFGTDTWLGGKTLKLYNVDKFCWPGLAAMEGGSTASSKVNTEYENRAVMVENVVHSINDEGSNVLRITYNYNGASVTKFADIDLAYPSEQKNLFVSAPPEAKDVQKGDIIMIETNATGDISQLMILFSTHNKPDYYYCQKYNSSSVTRDPLTMDTCMIIYGKIVDRRDNVALVNVSEDGTNDMYEYPLTMGHGGYGWPFYSLCDSESGKITAVSVDGIQDGDVVFMRKYYNHVIDVFILR